MAVERLAWAMRGSDMPQGMAATDNLSIAADVVWLALNECESQVNGFYVTDGGLRHVKPNVHGCVLNASPNKANDFAAIGSTL